MTETWNAGEGSSRDILWDISTIDSETINICDKFETIPQHLDSIYSEDIILNHYSTSQDLDVYEMDTCRALLMRIVVNKENIMKKISNKIMINGLQHMCETLLDKRLQEEQ